MADKPNFINHTGDNYNTFRTKEEIISFEEYCVVVENLSYYNFFTDEEWEVIYDRYNKYIGLES